MPRPLDNAWEIAQGWVADGVVPGVAIAVARAGELVGEFYAGKQSAGAGRPVGESTLYSIASITKPFTAATLMRLVDRGVIGLDESVRRTVPAFSGANKRQITLRDLLCHLAGLPKDDSDEARLWAAQADFATIVESAANLTPIHPRGERVSYSNAGYWLVGAAIASVTGSAFPDVLRTEVLEPLGLADTFITPPESAADRMARRYGRQKIMNAPYGRGLGSPSSGIFATARDLVRFASVFLAGDVGPDGYQWLSRASVKLMTTDQTGGLPGGIEGIREWPVCAWGLGWEVKGEKIGHWTGDLTSPATFAHPGQSGTLLWADPASGIAVALLANRDLSTGWWLAPAHWARINNAIVAGAKPNH
jgi:CubicO group peptidase (beta-lactamase class C family)